MGWIFGVLSILGFLWALGHLRATLIFLGVIATPPGAVWGGYSLALAGEAAVDMIRTIAWSIVLLVVPWPVLVTWVLLVWAIALLLKCVLSLIVALREETHYTRTVRLKLTLWKLVYNVMCAIAFVVCVYKLGI
jgi:hypothetical protein